MGVLLVAGFLMLAAAVAAGWSNDAGAWLLGGALLYVGGTFIVTGIGNVPLNNQLAAVPASDPGAAPVWDFYLERWTRLNTIRTCAAAAATLMYAMGLVRLSIG